MWLLTLSKKPLLVAARPRHNRLTSVACSASHVASRVRATRQQKTAWKTVLKTKSTIFCSTPRHAVNVKANEELIAKVESLHLRRAERATCDRSGVVRHGVRERAFEIQEAVCPTMTPQALRSFSEQQQSCTT